MSNQRFEEYSDSISYWPFDYDGSGSEDSSETVLRRTQITEIRRIEPIAPLENSKDIYLSVLKVNDFLEVKTLFL